ncbi:hypothetical protein LZP81_12940 [Streptomyces parvulus]|uniref:Uncharacterized protein n=1 Tax=Streptomyces parvulus TaxID=146923 RepID=A0A191V758_9ACTN|nr:MULTISPECIES: hypothetical protein [Streptomyces]ANJ10755.1 hypothetical protein Spa2297_29505 [Streptomyces parvulus]MCC9155506.1 hypothetical protein [Streptomyces parvulus]MCE7687760.1 hypothetical protein [Streptomyces parvulus]MCQ4196383.1 hypothetical protein [Streptomyces parvulus]MZD56134.1 hypothetical protein [Streptomyces sp. SID5606]
MVYVAVLLLPGVGLLLFTMTYLEDRLFAEPVAARHARRRHLRLLPGGRRADSAPRRADPASAAPRPAEQDAAA